LWKTASRFQLRRFALHWCAGLRSVDRMKDTFMKSVKAGANLLVINQATGTECGHGLMTLTERSYFLQHQPGEWFTKTIAPTLEARRGLIFRGFEIGNDNEEMS
jgi:hypothetical protein